VLCCACLQVLFNLYEGLVASSDPSAANRQRRVLEAIGLFASIAAKDLVTAFFNRLFRMLVDAVNALAEDPAGLGRVACGHGPCACVLLLRTWGLVTGLVCGVECDVAYSPVYMPIFPLGPVCSPFTLPSLGPFPLLFACATGTPKVCGLLSLCLAMVSALTTDQAQTLYAAVTPLLADGSHATVQKRAYKVRQQGAATPHPPTRPPTVVLFGSTFFPELWASAIAFCVPLVCLFD
jgi:hypothetical protein